jgi:hypothetical protein
LDIFAALLVLALLQIKHMFADFFLQTPGMLSARSVYVHTGRAMHCVIHIAGTAVVLLLFGVSPLLLIGLLIAEWIVHYHIDFAKGYWSDKAAHSPEDSGFWRAFGADQMLHQLTYILMIAALL